MRSRLANVGNDGDALPDEIYIGFIDSLLVDVRGLLLAGTAMLLAGSISAAASRSLSLWACTAGIGLILLFRWRFMASHARGRPSSNAEIARRREGIFLVGAVLFMFALSMWTFVAFLVTDDGFTRFFTASTTFTYAFGMWTRSFALDRGINAQIVVAGTPLSAAMIVAGGWYPWMIVVGFIPLFAFIKASSTTLQKTFRAEVAARIQSAMLAERLDTAVNNMSHGLCMIDRSARLMLANEKFHKIFRLPVDEPIVGRSALEVFHAVARASGLDESHLEPLSAAIVNARSQSADAVVPLDAPDGRAIEITVHGTKDGGIVLVVQDVTERRNAQLAIDRMARFDAVTELPNRRSFEEELAKALAEPATAGQITVLFLDLDDFKQVNDSLGHRTGDALLAEIAQRLRAIVGRGDMVARWGGDEFVILHRDGERPADAPALAKRIIEEVGRPVVIAGCEVIVGASIGSASAPADGVSPEHLLCKADIALYAAKADGRRAWRAFESAMDTRIQVRRLVELELRAAVANQAVEVHFQPIVDVRSRRIVAFEALARWRHPLRGAVAPSEFVPILEDIGLMEEFGAVVLRRACAACASWPEDVRVSVNLSSSQLRSANLQGRIAEALGAANLSPGRLDIEITESTLLDHRSDTRAALEALRALGLRVSLDDFGTGYSSLSYLLGFPLDRVKIDRSFTIGLGLQERASIVVESVAAMSRKLGMTVVIEGVETERQMRVIETLGTIAEVQGYLFSPPVAESSVAQLMGDLGAKAA
ncbi:MAG: EAL domain-containing protein [Hyphomicrobiales bacterium]|nr:EAL domain-containing protein [Hyphomicrobiales bacterium]